MLLALCGLLLTLRPVTWALHESDAGVTDWYKAFVGVPQTFSPSISPRFHRISDGVSSESKIIVPTQQNTLASLDPLSGRIAWRQSHDNLDPLVHVKTDQRNVFSLSGIGGSRVTAYDSTSGHIIWEVSLHHTLLGRLSQPAGAGTDLAISSDGSRDVFVLSNSNSVQRISRVTGEIIWKWEASDEASLNLHSKLVVSDSRLYVVGLVKSFASYTLHVTFLDPTSGKESDSSHIPSSIKNGLDDIVIVGPTSNPHLVWVENGQIKSYTFSDSHTTTIKEKNFARVLDVGLTDHGLFVATKIDGAAQVYRVGDGVSGKVPSKIWEFVDSAGSSKQSPSIFSGGLDKDNMAYISRIFYSLDLQVANIQLFAPDGAEGTGLLNGLTFPFDTNSHGVIRHVALDVAHPEEYVFISRVVLTTSTGAVQLWQSDKVQWTREESLSEIEAVEFVDLPEKQIVKSQLAAESEPFVNKLQRQAVEIQNLPSYIVRFGTRFVTGDYETVASTVDSDAQNLYRDTFGFRKILVAVTSTGKVFGLDTSHGAILWSRILGSSDESGSSLSKPRVHVYHSVWDGATSPEVVIVAQNKQPKETVVIRLDALTGAVVTPARKSETFFNNHPAEVFFLSGDGNRTIVAVDNDLKIHLFPSDDETKSSFLKLAPKVYFTRKTGHPSNERIIGYKISSSAHAGPIRAYQAWTTSFPPSESIQSTFKPTRGQVASLGKVLADRSTLYKYLNPHILGVITKDIVLPQSSVYLVDSISGTVLYHAEVNTTGLLQATIAENWLVYTYFADAASPAPDAGKGQQIVTVELYEGSARNDKTRSPDSSSFSYDNTQVTPYQHSYLFPHGISALSITSTKYGISSKDLIVATDKNQIQSFQRRILDPRRHKEKPSAADGEEMLIPYDPILPDDPRRVLSHNNEVVGTRRIITSPALLESTSLVFTYGQDLFFTRVAPSNTFDVLSEDFNKVQLTLTVFGLGLAILITKPIVQRNQLNQRWYS